MSIDDIAIKREISDSIIKDIDGALAGLKKKRRLKEFFQVLF